MFFLVFNEMGSSAYKWTALIFKFSHRVFFVLRGLANLAETRKPTCPPLSLSLFHLLSSPLVLMLPRSYRFPQNYKESIVQWRCIQG